MHRNRTSIPVGSMADKFGAGIAIERLYIRNLSAASEKALENFEQARQSHRHTDHSFFLLEKGTVSIEIDFQQYKLRSPALIYMHPDQVHRITAFKNVTVCAWAVTDENLRPEYLSILEDITPAKPLLLNKEMVSIISEAVSLVMKFSARKTDKLYASLLKDSCNALVALAASQYLEQSKSTDKLSRFEIVTKAFREVLERDYGMAKRPTAYAKELHISTAYLNECVKNTTGYSVSQQIQQRVILEAKRLLYHSDKSVKEIATGLGYDDCSYFSRQFTRVAGMTASAFRNKNHD